MLDYGKFNGSIAGPIVGGIIAGLIMNYIYVNKAEKKHNLNIFKNLKILFHYDPADDISQMFDAEFTKTSKSVTKLQMVLIVEFTEIVETYYQVMNVSSM